MNNEFQQILESTAADVNQQLDNILTDKVGEGEVARPAKLVAAMRHGLLNGGKRLRPFLVIQSAGLFGVAPAQAMQTACALECLHSYSLIHDDLPAMDDDDLRRGQPTVHKAFDEATAILAGDALLRLWRNAAGAAATARHYEHNKHIRSSGLWVGPVAAKVGKL